ncbi:MAG: hypothetical protein HYV32_01340 [Candidatus Kerfeldbacteria bacterium]|nr:hypothetical protein [Candidatus Kerfeldbacteria bacterium]
MKISKKFASGAAITLGWVATATTAFAQITTSGDGYDEISDNLGTNDPVNIVTDIVNLALSLLALVAVIIIIIGGFKWMTAAGDPGKVDKAKKLLVAAVIGLAFVMISWALATYVIGKLAESTNANIQGMVYFV